MYPRNNNAPNFKSRYFNHSRFSNPEPLSIYAFPLAGPQPKNRTNAFKRKADTFPVDNPVIFGAKKPRYNDNFLNNKGNFNQNKKNPQQNPANKPPRFPSQRNIFNKIIDVANTNQIFNSSLPPDEVIDSKVVPQVVYYSQIIKDYSLENLGDNVFVIRVDNEIKRTVDSVALPEPTYQAVLKKVIDDLNKSFKIEGYTNKWNLFGSFLYGLVNEDSDIDVYYECINNGYIDSKPESIPVKMRKSLQKSRKFHKVTFIRNARIPIVRAIHNETKKQIDISFSHGLGVRNSLLTKLYLNLNPSLKYLTLYLKGILRKYHTLGTGKITTHILFWLVGFFMQQKKLLPAVIDVREAATVTHNVAGWDCSLPEDYSFSFKPASLYSLLLEFFAFYKDFDFLNYVICPFVGRAIRLSDFEQLRIPADEFSAYLKRLENPEQCTFSRSVVNLQDPSDLGFNLAKQVAVQYASKFKQICYCLSNLLPNTVNDLRKINSLREMLPNHLNFDRFKLANLVQYCSFLVQFPSLPEYCVNKLNHSYLLEAVRKLMELVFEFKKVNIVSAPNIAQVSFSDGKIIRNTASVIYFEYRSTENTWKNDFIKEIITRNGDEKKQVKVYLTTELCFDRNLIRVFIQTQTDFIRFFHENSAQLFSFALTEVIPYP